MAKVLTNFSGTTSASFCIGKRGVTVISGTAVPLNSVGNNGDIYVLKGINPKFFQKHTTWIEVGTKNLQAITTTTMIETIYPEEVLLTDTTSKAVTITLTTSSLSVGYTVVIKDTGGNASINNITIATQGSEKIDGQNTIIIDSNYKSVTLFSDGTNWYTI